MLRAALEAQAPPKQSLEGAIDTLSNRLANASLLEDRRSAILGLRSFADQYPATVASKALRALISALGRDVADVDTGKVVLETLLKIVNPKPDSLEASDQVALWIADQFTQRQDHITLLLDLLENDDFYCRLYTLQLLQAISTSRPERTQESILSAPLGIARLVATLDDRREAVQGAGVLLLNEITQDSVELQKVVAFENTFERLIALIQQDGSLSAGRELAEDCMNLLAKLLHLNASNQSLFRESGCIGKLAQILVTDARERQESKDEDDSTHVTRGKNSWGLLTLLRMFLVEGNPGCKANQNAFAKQGLLQLVLDLAFSGDLQPPLRAEAMRTCADIIKANGQIQERFAHNQVSPNDQHDVDGANGKHVNGNAKVYVIDALLDIALSTPSIAMFDVRYAASECIHAYFYNHTPIRRHFLQRAVHGHESGEDETSNFLTTLIQGPRSSSSTDPYRPWFAAELCVQLVFEDTEAKNMIKGVSEGDADSGEDVVTCIQALVGNLLESLQSAEDDRVSTAYFMVLCVCLFDDANAVNDLLIEGSTLQSLIQTASSDGRGKVLLQGLSTFLLGIIYEFSTKDSPIPRRKLQPLLTSGLGREHYVSRLSRLRGLPLVRDFEVLPQGLASAEEGSLPEVYLDQLFVNFLKDNFSRIIRAIDRDPGIEVARVTEGIDRDLVDSLREQIKDKSEALEKLQAGTLDVQGKLGQEQADSRRSQERFVSELGRIKNINEALQKGHDEDVMRLRGEHMTDRQGLVASHKQKLESVEARLRSGREEYDHRATALAEEHRKTLKALDDKNKEEGRQIGEQHQTKLRQLQDRVGELEGQSQKSQDSADKLRQLNEMLTKRVKEREEQIDGKNKDKQLLEEDMESHLVRAGGLERQIKDLKAQVKDLERKVQDSGKEQTALQVQLNAKEEARLAAQTELDDLLMILGDLEEKRRQDKARLKELGASTSDDDEDEDEEADENKEDQSDKSSESDEADVADKETEEEEADDSVVVDDAVAADEAVDEPDEDKDGGDLSGSRTPVPTSPTDKGHNRESSVD